MKTGLAKLVVPHTQRLLRSRHRNMVVEQLTEPEASFKEIRRVLRPGGRFLLHTPNLRACVTVIACRLPSSLKRALARALDGRKADDVYRTFYRCNPEGALRQFAQNGQLPWFRFIPFPPKPLSPESAPRHSNCSGSKPP